MYVRFLAAFAALSLFSGCAIRPLPEDVAGVDTYHIVRQIRCEVRETIRSFIIGRLKKLGSDNETQAGDPIAQRLALQYESDPDSIASFRPSLLSGPSRVKVRGFFELFYDTGIAYNFDLTMTEDNDLSTDLNLLKPLPAFSLGVSAGATRERSNNRTFTVTDTFSYLITTLNTPVRGVHYCDGQVVQANYVYPIAGRIGIDKLVTSFVELTLFANLAGKESNPGAGGAPTMADKLTFTTTINASATPKIVFAPGGHAFQFADASFTGSVRRSDVHQVTVALAISTGAAGTVDPFRSYVFSSERGARSAARSETTGRPAAASSLIVGRRVTGGGTPSEQLAVVAIDQLKSRELQLIPAP